MRPALRIFYPYKQYLNSDRLRFDNPAILVSNHPNTLIDVLTVAAKTKKLVFFLANAGLFKSPFGNWFFNTFYCIPVQRPQDTGGSQQISNEASFSQANEHLSKGGVLYIAPEGTSEMERRLRPLKTGTARIALSTEKKNNYQLDLLIVPVGLTYYRPEQCGSRMMVQVGEPIRPREYQADYEADPVQAARKLTADLEEQLGGLMINTRDELEDQRLRMLESIRQNEQPLSGEARYRREFQLLEQWQGLPDDRLGIQLDQYRELLREAGIKDRIVSRQNGGGFSLVGLLTLPLYLYGLVNNFLPTQVPVWVSKKLNLYRGYNATVKILVGLITIPLFYWLQTKLVGWCFGPGWQWPYFLSLPVSGLLAWRLSRRLRQLRMGWKYRQLPAEKKAALQQARAAINEQWLAATE